MADQLTPDNIPPHLLGEVLEREAPCAALRTYMDRAKIIASTGNFSVFEHAACALASVASQVRIEVENLKEAAAMMEEAAAAPQPEGATPKRAEILRKASAFVRRSIGEIEGAFLGIEPS